MFLSREYRSRAVGVAAAYAVLVAGIVLTAALDSSPAKGATQATIVAPERREIKRLDDCASSLEDRSEIVC